MGILKLKHDRPVTIEGLFLGIERDDVLNIMGPPRTSGSRVLSYEDITIVLSGEQKVERIMHGKVCKVGSQTFLAEETPVADVISFFGLSVFGTSTEAHLYLPQGPQLRIEHDGGEVCKSFSLVQGPQGPRRRNDRGNDGDSPSHIPREPKPPNISGSHQNDPSQ
jgi:hypothetical protein